MRQHIDIFRKLSEEDEKKLNIEALVIAPIVLFLLMEHLYINTSIIMRMTTALLCLNSVFWILNLTVLFFALGQLSTALRIQTILMLFIGLLNHYLRRF